MAGKVHHAAEQLPVRIPKTNHPHLRIDWSCELHIVGIPLARMRRGKTALHFDAPIESHGVLPSAAKSHQAFRPPFIRSHHGLNDLLF